MDYFKHVESFYNFDDRCDREKEKQYGIISNIVKNNFKKFKIDSSKPSKKQNIHHITKYAYFKDGWYCKYTDNIDCHSSFEISIPILSIHGCPGYWHDWNQIEKNYGDNQGRWINFFVPGFDKESEIRGSYDGSEKDLTQLIYLLLEKLKIKKVIIMAHSMGGIVFYNYYKRYRETVAGVIYVTAPGINWYIGMITFYTVANASNSLNRQIGERYWLFNMPKFRKVLRQKFLKDRQQIYFQNQIYIPPLSEFELCAFIKLNSSLKNFSELFDLAKNVKVLKFFAYGQEDPLIEKTDVSSFFYYEYQKYKQDNNIAQIIQQTLQNNIDFKNIDFNWYNIQSNFMFSFENTGHNVHKKQGWALGQPLRCFVKVIQELNNNNYQLILHRVHDNQMISNNFLNYSKPIDNQNFQQQEYQQMHQQSEYYIDDVINKNDKNNKNQNQQNIAQQKQKQQQIDQSQLDRELYYIDDVLGSKHQDDKINKFQNQQNIAQQKQKQQKSDQSLLDREQSYIDDVLNKDDKNNKNQNQQNIAQQKQKQQQIDQSLLDRELSYIDDVLGSKHQDDKINKNQNQQNIAQQKQKQQQIDQSLLDRELYYIDQIIKDYDQDFDQDQQYNDQTQLDQELKNKKLLKQSIIPKL